MGVFLFLTLTFLALAIANFGGGNTWASIGGYLGIITAILAWYTATAGMLAAGKSAFQLPTFPMG
jgi:succinate-acetate transporter protein